MSDKIDKYRFAMATKTTTNLITETMRHRLFKRRALLLGGGQLALGGLLAGRMAYMAVIDNDRYQMQAESNRVDVTLLPPRRGWIIDRNGAILADNRVAHHIDINPKQVADVDATIEQLVRLLELDADKQAILREALTPPLRGERVTIADNLDEETYASVLVRLPTLDGVHPVRSYRRHYPLGSAAGHLLGYVGTPTPEEYQQTKDPMYVTPGFKLGREAIEKYFEPKLRGTAGFKRDEVTAQGEIVRNLEVVPDGRGATIQLTIDAGLQEYAARRLGTESGAVVVIDCTSGDVLAQVSMPSFDPNSFADKIKREEWAMLRADDHTPLINKALRGLYPPGSTLKPMAALALLAANIDPQEIIRCTGGYRLGSTYFRCLGVHGAVDMSTAIKRSCNTYFYAMGLRLGYDPIAKVGRDLGLGLEYPLAGSNQRFGTVPDSAWKLRRHGNVWRSADTLNAVIGQGYVLVNPLQLAVMTARIASGKAVLPQLTSRGRSFADLAYPPSHLALVRAAMGRVVNDGGTAVRSRLPLRDVQMAGKTGTAQVVGRQAGVDSEDIAWKYRDHGLFVGFAPLDVPRYAIAVIVEHGRSGSRAAGPVARDVVTWLYDQDKAMERLAVLERGWGGSIEERMAQNYAQWLAGDHPAQSDGQGGEQ